MINLSQTLTRTTIADPTFPKDGSRISLTVALTPPYSLLKGNGEELAEAPVLDRYRWLEYHKWNVLAEWYTTLVEKLVLKFEGKFGILGAYDSRLG
ncbi:hypothetical protein RZS08_63835, partial [Arthrospira platensis SPKY1]|nr:hypothetical protein [Arthrospira platensis SPKY1]